MTEQAVSRPPERPPPKLSVVMPVYNGEAYLEAALDSVLGQSFRDLEFVIVDDGSGDRSWTILEEYAARDGRIALERFEENRGHDVASNRALELARGRYIARHDQDDVLLPGWLEHAADFLDRHPAIGLVSGPYYPLVDGVRGELRRPPTEHEELRATLLFHNVICHPSVVVRAEVRSTGELHYRPFSGPQDYDLWVRLLAVTRATSLDRPAVLYRRHRRTMSAQFSGELPREVQRISNRQLRRLLGEDTGRETLDSLRRLWRAHDVGEGDLRHLGLLLAALRRFGADPGNRSRRTARVARRAARRVLSRVVRRRGWSRPALAVSGTLVRFAPRALVEWVLRDLPAAALRRARTAGADPERPAKQGADGVR